MSEATGPVVRVEGGEVVATMTLGAVSAAAVLERWTDPGALRAWWGGDLTADLEPGGAYAVGFPQLGQTMRGTVRAYEPGALLEFSWRWDHESGGPDRTVRVSVADTGSGVRLTVRHGPHGSGPDEARAIAEHVEGWQHFLPRLAASLR